MSHFLIYVRRSYKLANAADVSDETQESVARALLPPGATSEVIRDSGGHNSGFSEHRDGYQELIRRVAQGGIAGIAVYDLSRLARNVRLMANLLHELDRQQIVILAGNLPQTRMDSAVGRFMFHMLVAAAEFQRNLDSERMTAQMRSTFEDGGHRGNDPFGYRTLREDGQIVHPRTLVVVPDEAEVVRRVFAELPTKPFSEVAALLNAEGTKHRKPRAWTTAAVKDIWRRRDFYCGNVTTGRGLEVRPGRHPAILASDAFRDAVAGVESRKRHQGAKPSRAKRLYLLRGLVWCQCGARMRGSTRVARGHEWPYYICPIARGRSARLASDGDLVACHAPSVPADAAARHVLAALSELVLPDDVIEAAREDLRERLRAPAPGAADAERARLKVRVGKLADLYSWGDITEAEYRRQKGQAEAQLTQLPDTDKLVHFDRHREILVGLADNIARATPEQLQALVAKLVERVDTTDKQVTAVVFVPAARPFFANQDCVALAPPDGLEPPTHALGRHRSIH